MEPELVNPTTNLSNPSVLPERFQSEPIIPPKRSKISWKLLIIFIFVIAGGIGFFIFIKPTYLLKDNKSTALSPNKESLTENIQTKQLKTQIVLASPTATPITITDPLPKLNQGQVLFANQKSIFIYDSDKGEIFSYEIVFPELTPVQTKKEVTIEKLSFSPDYKYLFVTFTNGEVAFINYPQKQIIKLLSIGPNGAPVSFSKDNKYTIFDVGTGPGARGRLLIQLEDGKEIGNWGGRGFIWSNNSSKIAAVKEEVELSMIATGPSPSTNSIVLELIEGNSLKEQKVLTGTNQVSWGVIDWIDNDTIRVEKAEFPEPYPLVKDEKLFNDSDFQSKWMGYLEHPQISYWKYHLSTKESERDTDYVRPQSKPWDRGSYSPNKEWKALAENGNIIAILSKDNSTRYVIGEGSDVVWMTNN